MYDFPHYMVGMHWLWWLFWVLVIVAVWWTLLRPARPDVPLTDTPLDRLQRRYADGEITTEEYEERKAILLRDR